ncbi:hypothetical protein R84B8_00097 [Treponema sp. R8-4-B8]
MKRHFFACCLLCVVSLVTALIVTSCEDPFYYPPIQGTLSISPSSGPVGTTFTVKYSGLDGDKIAHFNWYYEDGSYAAVGSTCTPQKSGMLIAYTELSATHYSGISARVRVSEKEYIPPTVYSVRIGTLTNDNGSTVEASPLEATKDTEITVKVYEAIGYRLKPNTLKYNYSDNNGSTISNNINESSKKFYMPEAGVTITAEFESDGTIESGEAFIGTWRYGYTDGTNVQSLTLTINRNKTSSLFLTSTNTTVDGTYSQYDGSKMIVFTFNNGTTTRMTSATLVVNNLVFTAGSLDFIGWAGRVELKKIE